MECLPDESPNVIDIESGDSPDTEELSEQDESFYTTQEDTISDSDDKDDETTQRASPRRLRDRGNRPDYRQLHSGKQQYHNKKVQFVVRAAKIVPKRPPVPRNFYEALTGPDKDNWMGALENELNSLETQCVWDLVPVPSGQKILPGRWVLVHKLGPIEDIVSYKARWVAKGFAQQYGLDYDLTYST